MMAKPGPEIVGRGKTEYKLAVLDLQVRKVRQYRGGKFRNPVMCPDYEPGLCSGPTSAITSWNSEISSKLR